MCVYIERGWSLCFCQPDGEPGVGEVALDPLFFGGSKTLLNANHYDVYFNGMPCVNGLVIKCFDWADYGSHLAFWLGCKQAT